MSEKNNLAQESMKYLQLLNFIVFNVANVPEIKFSEFFLNELNLYGNVLNDHYNMYAFQKNNLTSKIINDIKKIQNKKMDITSLDIIANKLIQEFETKDPYCVIQEEHISILQNFSQNLNTHIQLVYITIEKNLQKNKKSIIEKAKKAKHTVIKKPKISNAYLKKLIK